MSVASPSCGRTVSSRLARQTSLGEGERQEGLRPENGCKLETDAPKFNNTARATALPARITQVVAEASAITQCRALLVNSQNSKALSTPERSCSPLMDQTSVNFVQRRRLTEGTAHTCRSLPLTLQAVVTSISFTSLRGSSVNSQNSESVHRHTVGFTSLVKPSQNIALSVTYSVLPSQKIGVSTV